MARAGRGEGLLENDGRAVASRAVGHDRLGRLQPELAKVGQSPLQEGRTGGRPLVGMLLDCAESCQVSANFMLRGSPYHTIMCAACAELCRACEEACRAIPGDEQMEHCAEVCAACAETCARMAEMDEEGEEDEDMDLAPGTSLSRCCRQKLPLMLLRTR